jgi:hypothetical protein
LRKELKAMIGSFLLFWIVSIEARNLRHDTFLFVICSFKDDVSESQLHVHLKFWWKRLLLVRYITTLSATETA